MKFILFLISAGLHRLFNWTVNKSDVLLSIGAGTSVFQFLKVPTILNIILNIPDDFIKLLFSLLTTCLCTVVAFYTRKKLEKKSNKPKNNTHE